MLHTKMPSTLKMATSWTIFLLLNIILLFMHDSCAVHVELPNTIQNILYVDTDIYIGANNTLYRLKKDDLSIVANVTTGPHLDHPLCIKFFTAWYCDKGGKEKITNNLNKLLFMTTFKTKKWLISCGSLYHGTCYVYTPDTLQVKSKRGYIGIAGSRQHGALASMLLGDYMLIGTQTAKSYNRRNMYPLSLRFLNNDPLLEDNDKPFLEKEEAFEYQDQYKPGKNDTLDVGYVISFRDGQYAYMGTVQKVHPTSSSYYSKLIRVCTKSQKILNSYIELGLKCTSGDIDYNVLISASFVNLYGPSASNLGVTNNTKGFLALFGKSQPSSRSLSGKDYAVCFYNMSSVNQIFDNTVTSCLKDGKGKGVPWFKDDAQTPRNAGCQKVRSSLNKLSLTNFGPKFIQRGPM